MSSGLLSLTQWLSPAFPIGSYAYSHGLEAAIDTGDICDAQTLEAWLKIIVLRGSGKTDAVLLARSHAGDDLAATARALLGFKHQVQRLI